MSISGLLLEGETSEVTLEGGRYTLVGRLGSGGMAQVYLAWDRRLSVWRAVKILASRKVENRRALVRFHREARIMAGLDHPDLIRVYDLEHHEGRPYIVMELVTGGSLWDWVLRHRRPLPIRDAVEAAVSVCNGLVTAHERGVIHRDIKPNNVLITPEGCKLTDFGIALLEGTGRERRGSRLGTEGFLAPEQSVEPGRVDERADLFALGAMLFTVATVSNPRALTGADDERVLRAVHPDVRPLIRRATAWDPSQRPQNASEMLAELEHVLLSLPRRQQTDPPLYQSQFELPGFDAVPTGPSVMTRARTQVHGAPTVRMQHALVAEARLMDDEAEEPTFPGEWPSEDQLAAGTAGFMVGASVIGVALTLMLYAMFLMP